MKKLFKKTIKPTVAYEMGGLLYFDKQAALKDELMNLIEKHGKASVAGYGYADLSSYVLADNFDKLLNDYNTFKENNNV